MSLVRIQREQRGWTMTALAARAGMSLSKLSRIESTQRKCKVDDVLRLARALGCRPSALLPELDEDSQESAWVS
jgi:transcriptional regulator with XRE-family HTH domain